MTPTKDQVGNAGAPQFEAEPFDVAYKPLAQTPLIEAGICFHPDCARPFNPAVPWQIYCSAACRQAAKSEFRRVGILAAPALLAHRAGKHAGSDQPELRELSAAGRNYITRLQGDWRLDRMQRKARAEIERG